MSFSAVTCQACPVKELCTKREKHKGRILTLSPQRVHEARERRRAGRSPEALDATAGGLLQILEEADALIGSNVVDAANDIQRCP